MQPTLKPLGKEWYKEIFTMNIKNESWVENTQHEVDFLIRHMQLHGHEHILDMACGFGRHALEFAKRGFRVTGVDINAAYIEDAKKSAHMLQLSNVSFIQSDIRDLHFHETYDVVLNLADGAIGYFDSDGENDKIFDKIADALKPGGKHFLDICNAEYAESHFPCTQWSIGEKAVSLSKFEWNPQTRTYLFGSQDIIYGQIAEKPIFDYGAPIRIYSISELQERLQQRGLYVLHTYSDYDGTPASNQFFQLKVYSQKKS